MISLGRLIWKEILHRKLNCLLSLLAVVFAVGLFVAFLTTAAAARRETTRVTRDMGFNLRIIPKETDMDRFWVAGFSDQTMPEEAIHRFAKAGGVFFSYNHLVATLQQRFSVQGKEIFLTGLSPTLTAPDQKKQPMGFEIKAGTVHLGYQVARRLELKQGDSLELAGRKFRVERALVESGTDDDIRVFGLLSDVQRVLNMEGRINEIKAIDCLCLTADQDLYSLDARGRARYRAREIGFVFQMFHLVPYLTVMENVLLAARPEANGVGAARARELLGHLGLAPRLDHTPGELSAGERQRTAIARALLNQPKLILADEPTGNLDPENAAEVFRHLEEFHRGGGTVIVVTHGSSADEYADRVVELRGGRMIVP